MHYQHTCCILVSYSMCSVSKSATKNKNKKPIIYSLFVASNFYLLHMVFISLYGIVKNWFIPLRIFLSVSYLLLIHFGEYWNFFVSLVYYWLSDLSATFYVLVPSSFFSTLWIFDKYNIMSIIIVLSSSLNTIYSSPTDIYYRKKVMNRYLIILYRLILLINLLILVRSVLQRCYDETSIYHDDYSTLMYEY